MILKCLSLLFKRELRVEVVFVLSGIPCHTHCTARTCWQDALPKCALPHTSFWWISV